MVVALALEGVPEIGVVGHQHHDPAVLIRDRPDVRDRAVGATLGRLSAGARPEADRWNLRDVPDVVQDVKELVLERQVDDRIPLGGKALPIWPAPVERAVAPEGRPTNPPLRPYSWRRAASASSRNAPPGSVIMTNGQRKSSGSVNRTTTWLYSSSGSRVTGVLVSSESRNVRLMSARG